VTARALIHLQTFEGSFPLGAALATALGVAIEELEVALRTFVPVNSAYVSEECRRDLWGTILAIRFFETKLAGEKRIWELVEEKARAWITGLMEIEEEDIKRLQQLAEKVLRAI
jgi:hypothetical protein